MNPANEAEAELLAIESIMDRYQGGSCTAPDALFEIGQTIYGATL